MYIITKEDKVMEEWKQHFRKLTETEDIQEEKEFVKTQEIILIMEEEIREAIGENPPPLPMSEPPNNTTYPVRRHHTLETSGSLHGRYGESSSNKTEWNSPPTRPSSAIQPNDHKKSSRIMDLFRKKRHSQI